MYNRRLAFQQVKDFIFAGPVPSAPLNKLAMLTDYIAPEQRHVACPNQDVVYGAGFVGLDISPVVIQVPDFGGRFWVYQIVDTRTDSFATLGKMYGTTPGFYMLVGPNWQGQMPKGITQTFRASTNSGFVGPRLFMDDTADDRRAIQSALRPVMMYPLSEYDGTVKSKDWNALPKSLDTSGGGEAETQWVFPEKFFDELPAVLADAPPLPGEEARYAQVLAAVEAAKRDPKLMAAMTQAAVEADTQLVKPLFEFRNYGLQLPGHWSQWCRFRHRLPHPHGGGEIQHPGQPTGAGKVFLSGPGYVGRPTQRLQPLHNDVREGSDAACQRLLVADALQ
jgi:hypothetical protein